HAKGQHQDDGDDQVATAWGHGRTLGVDRCGHKGAGYPSRMPISRRWFLASLAAAPELLAADPYRWWHWRPFSDPVRVRGRVTVDGVAAPRVVVSDGITVVTTDRDGRYTLLADPTMPAVFVSTPGECVLPTSVHGTLMQHVPLNGQREQRADF